MSVDPTQATATQSNGSPVTKDEANAVQTMSLAFALDNLARRLVEMEKKLDAHGNPRAGKILEFWKAIFSGWPAFGLVFILLFYSPLRAALNSIPDKVKNANEIAAFGVSLKSTIKAEAAKVGDSKLSETIPSLSNAAVQLLLRAPTKSESLVSYTPNDQNQFVEIHFPSPAIITALTELQNKGLIEINAWDGQQRQKLTGADLTKAIEEFRRENPGAERESFSEERSTWVPNTPLPKASTIPAFDWELSEFGKKGVDVVLKAVSAELAPKPQTQATP